MPFPLDDMPSHAADNVRRAEGSTGVEPSSMAHRQTDLKSIIAALAALPLLAACSSTQTPPAARERSKTSLSQNDISVAEAVARQAIADERASVSSASVSVRPGRVLGGNTGHPCTSGRELQIRLIGKFPLTMTTGPEFSRGSPSPDSTTVQAVNITADAESGNACLVSVQTGEFGEAKALPGGVTLSVG